MRSVVLDSTTILHSPDFLPDRLTRTGTPFKEAPHVDFARRYLRDPDFDFRETTYYELARRGRLAFPVRGRKAAALRCARFIDLIARIRTEGYRPERYHPISFVACTDGDLIVLNGKHRLAVLLALGVSPISAAVCFDNEVRARWKSRLERCRPQRFYRKSRDLIERVGSPIQGPAEAVDELVQAIQRRPLATKSDLYHPIPFHEFRHLSTQVDDATPYERLRMILAHCGDVSGKRVLDLGCNVGFYSFSLAKRGARVTALDTRKEFIDVANAVATIYAVPVTFLHTAVSPAFLLDADDRYDVVLCFSMLQWVIDQHGESYGRAILDAISKRSSALVFDVAVNRGKACLTCKPGHELAFSYNLLRSATSYETIRHIGDVRPYRESIRHVFYCT